MLPSVPLGRLPEELTNSRASACCPAAKLGTLAIFSLRLFCDREGLLVGTTGYLHANPNAEISHHERVLEGTFKSGKERFKLGRGRLRLWFVSRRFSFVVLRRFSLCGRGCSLA